MSISERERGNDMSEGAIEEGKVLGSPRLAYASLEGLTSDSRFIRVIDKAPLVTSWGIEDILPRQGLIKDAVVQRAMQMYGSYYRLPEDIRPETAKLENFGIGFEDKLPKEPKEGMAQYFSREGRNIRESVLMRFTSQAAILDRLVEDGFIVNGGSEFGRLQLNMLVHIDSGIGSLIKRLDRYPNRGRGEEAFERRQKIINFLNNCGIKERDLIEYRNGDRILTIPTRAKVEAGNLEDVLIKPGMHDLSSDLKTLKDENKLRDWKFLRSAVFLLSDPKIREVLEANKELSAQLGQYDTLDRNAYMDAIGKVSAARIGRYKPE